MKSLGWKVLVAAFVVALGPSAMAATRAVRHLDVAHAPPAESALRDHVAARLRGLHLHVSPHFGLHSIETRAVLVPVKGGERRIRERLTLALSNGGDLAPARVYVDRDPTASGAITGDRISPASLRRIKERLFVPRPSRRTMANILAEAGARAGRPSPRAISSSVEHGASLPMRTPRNRPGPYNWFVTVDGPTISEPHTLAIIGTRVAARGAAK